MTYIPLELGFSNPRGLKVQLIEHCVLGLRHDCRRADLAARPVRHAQPNDAAEPIGPQQGGEPRHRSPPVVASNDCRVGIESIQQAHHVTGKMQ